MATDMDDITSPPVWDPTRFRKPQRVPLSAKTVGEFVDWVGSAAMEDLAAVRGSIAEECDDEIVAMLGRELITLPIVDTSRHNILLSILGESRRDAAIDPLERFVWNVVDVLAPVEFGAALSIGPHQIVCDIGIDVGRALRSRAAEMLSYIATSRAIEGTVRVIREHPEADVRRAAIDAYLFNHDDSSEAAQAVTALARDEDRDWVGIPRRTLDSNPEEFRERVARLTERPPKPETVPRPTPRPDSPKRDHISTKPPEF